MNLKFSILQLFLGSAFALGLTIIGPSGSAEAQSFSGFVNLSSGHSIYVEYQAPTEGKDTLVLINGLDSEETGWQFFVNAFAPTGFGILRFDPYGMGFTLAKSGPVMSTISMDSQVEDLNELTMKLGLTGKLNLLGHSYGGGMAIAFAGRHPDRIKNAILLCPYTKPIAGVDTFIKGQISAYKMMNPFNIQSNESLYDYFLQLDELTIFPTEDPLLLTSPLKPMAVYELTQGIRKYNMDAASQFFPANSVHLVLAEADELIAPDVLASFWNQLPAGSRASFMKIQNSPHRVPQVYPMVLAEWAAEILNQNPLVYGAHEFEANPMTNAIQEIR